MANARIEKHGASDILASDGPHGTRYLRPDAVFIRASDGRVFISGNLLQGPLRQADGEDAERARLLPLVSQVGTFAA
jgi:hypothetical protein